MKMTDSEKKQKKMAYKLFNYLQKGEELIDALYREAKEDNALTDDIKDISEAHTQVQRAKTTIAFLTLIR